jgi:hypothetical protein
LLSDIARRPAAPPPGYWQSVQPASEEARRDRRRRAGPERPFDNGEGDPSTAPANREAIAALHAAADTLKFMTTSIADHGHRLRGEHHETYPSDPRQSAPEQLKTADRQPFVAGGVDPVNSRKPQRSPPR